MLRKHNDRRGAVLIWFAFILFAFFAMSALVIDVGLVVLAKGQMTGAVDAAAMTNARLKNETLAYQVFETHFSRHVSAYDPSDPTTQANRFLGAGARVDFTDDGVPLGNGVVADQGYSGVGVWIPSRDDVDIGVAATTLLRGTLPDGETDGNPPVPQLFSRLLFGRNVNGGSTAARAFTGINVIARTGLASEGIVTTVGVGRSTPTLQGISNFCVTRAAYQRIGPTPSAAAVMSGDFVTRTDSGPLSIGSVITAGSLIDVPPPEDAIMAVVEANQVIGFVRWLIDNLGTGPTVSTVSATASIENVSTSVVTGGANGVIPPGVDLSGFYKIPVFRVP